MATKSGSSAATIAATAASWELSDPMSPTTAKCTEAGVEAGGVSGPGERRATATVVARAAAASSPTSILRWARVPELPVAVPVPTRQR